jgi:ATP-dependent helicase/nuclease subunit A
VPADQRYEAALLWLEQSAGLEEDAVRQELAEAACSIIGDDSYSALFAPASLAEAPIAATLPDGRVVAGTVDRLVVEEERVRVVDFKTGRQVPRDAGSVPEHHRRQMDAYAAALAVIFPDKRIETALLYTSGPKLIDLGG